jgi:hypothetical protein
VRVSEYSAILWHLTSRKASLWTSKWSIVLNTAVPQNKAANKWLHTTNMLVLSSSCSFHRWLMAWIPPYMLALRPAQSWSIPHTSFASPPARQRTILANNLCQLSLALTSLTLGHLSNPKRRQVIVAR